MALSVDYAKISEALGYPEGIVDVVIDTDAYAEVDDDFAIVWALLSPERINVKAVYAAPFCPIAYMQRMMPPLPDGSKPQITAKTLGHLGHFTANPAEGMEKSYEEIRHIYDLMDIPSEGRVLRGSPMYIDDNNGAPVDSEAARDLIHRAMDQPDGSRLYVLAIGAITNVASAIMMEPAIVDKIVVVWLGGHAPFFKEAGEFNLASDMAASQVIFNSGVPLVLLPCNGVVDRLTLSLAEIEKYLLGKGRVADYLGQLVKSGINTSREALAKVAGSGLGGGGSMNDIPRELRMKFPTHHAAGTRVVWDISTVGYILNPNWVTSSLTPAPILNDDMTWSHDGSRHPIRLCYHVSRDYMFGDLFAKLASMERQI